MNISEATATATAATLVALAANQEQQPPANGAQPEKQQASTVVKLSNDGQQMNRDENQNAERTRQQENAEPQGIQFMEGERKGGRVDTFA